ncbi:MAG: HNH endonuclease, partial [Tolypothrix sp. Co-bin9]|nr:HNH endonuclease [Tolypothrix sp. Co-bin9]
MSNFVFLIDVNKQPLDPIPPGQGRRLLNQGHAAVYRRYPFTLILKKIVSDPKIQPHQLKIDPGSKTTGLAILQGDKVIWGAELTHRGQQIKNDLESRRAIRRGRRNRKARYRKPRFLNRTRQKGWLPPSLESRIKNTLTWVNKIIKYVPIVGISQELVKFDFQAMENPEFSGKEYQQGTLAGYEVKEYLLEKWNRKCAYCGVENVPFEIEHIHPKSKGGTDRVSNLALACHDCNQAKGNLDVKQFLAKKPAVLSRILS